MEVEPAHQPALEGLLRRREVQALAREAERCGSPAHLVGGAVRDALLRKEVRDLDAVVAGRGEEIAERLSALLSARRVSLGGDRFAAQRLVGHRFVLDLWDREETSLRDDLARRDLTVNAIALELSGEEGEARLVDPFGGRADLARSRLRAVTATSFTGDPLRVLRLPRFALQLPGFGPDRHTLELARAAVAKLPGVASERIREELGKLFQLPGTERALALLHALGLYPQLWLGHALTGEARDENRPLLHRAQRALERLPDASRRLAALGLPEPTADEQATARLALTFRALAPDADPRTALEAFRKAGYLSRGEAATLAPLLRLPPPPTTEPDRRSFLHQAGDPWRAALLLTTAEALAHPDHHPWTEQPLAALTHLAQREAPQLTHPPRLLTGHEVRDLLGIQDGQQLGQALAALEQAWVRGDVTTKEEAERWLALKYPR